MSKSIIINNLDSWFEDLAFVKRNDDAVFASAEDIQNFVIGYGSKYQWGTARCACVLVAAKEEKMIEESVWHEHKEVLSTGAACDLRFTMQIAKAEKKLTNGKLIKYSRFSGVVAEKKPEKDGKEFENTSPYPDSSFYVRSKSEIGIGRAKRYLKVDVIGHIRGQLAILAANDEDVKEAGKKLKMDITKVVKEFT